MIIPLSFFYSFSIFLSIIQVPEWLQKPYLCHLVWDVASMNGEMRLHELLLPMRKQMRSREVPTSHNLSPTQYPISLSTFISNQSLEDLLYMNLSVLICFVITFVRLSVVSNFCIYIVPSLHSLRCPRYSSHHIKEYFSTYALIPLLTFYSKLLHFKCGEKPIKAE